jgi:hypothetical protein
MKHLCPFLSLFAGALLLTAPGAQLRAAATPAPAVDKSGYTLSHPTPDSLLREMNTDRPDATEGPFTIDAGHTQVEMSFASFTRNRLDGDRSREWDLAPFNLRLGLLNNLEAGIFLSPFVRQVEEPRGGLRETRSGFGDVVVRVKLNFQGDDGGGAAYGLIADIKCPTAANGLGNGAVEGDLILPLACDLPGGWDLGAMTKIEARHRDGGGARAVWINTATLGHNLAPRLDGYAELTSEAGDGTHVATFNVGLTYKLDDRTQLDAGANLGISRAADDEQFFAGLSRRF